MGIKKPVRSTTTPRLHFRIETEREEDGRWIAEINAVPGALVYGKTEKQAKIKAYALALRVIADQVEESRSVLVSISVTCASA